MYELTEQELDVVTGAQGNGNGNAFGLVAVGLNASDFLNGNSVLNGNTVTVDVLNGSLNGVSVPIGIAVSVLGMSANAIRSTL
jgi:hypothetical protein